MNDQVQSRMISDSMGEIAVPEDCYWGAHLAELGTPTLIVQGTRDPFGGVEDIADYPPAPRICLHWVNGAGHDLIPPKSSGRSAGQAWGAAMDAIADFLAEVERAAG